MVDDIAPKVEIEGGQEAIETVTNIGTAGEEAFNKIGSAAEDASEHLGAIEAMAKRVGVSYDEMAQRIKEAGTASAEGSAAAGGALEAHAAKAHETAQALSELGTIGAEAFAKILASAASGDFTGIATQIGGKLVGAITEAIQAATEFVEQSAAMVETLNALSEATGMTVPELIGLKDAFASVGVSASTFERSVGRLAITISNDWAQIQQAVRTSADQQTGAMLHVQETALGMTKAYQNLQSVFTQTSQTAAHDSLNIESAALSLARAQDALNQASVSSRQNSLGVESATLALKRAQMNLDKDEGKKVSGADEKALKIEGDKLAVKQAQLQIENAQHAKQMEGLKAMEDELAVRKASQALSDARTKDIEDSIKGMNNLKEAQLNVQKAALAASEASERQHQVDLKDLPAIASQLRSVADGQKEWTDVTNHAEISARDFTKALILNAAAGKEMATTKDVIDEMARVFPKMGDSADAQAKKIAVMQQTMGAGFRAGQASAASMLAVFERGPEKLQALADSAEKLEKALGFETIKTNLTTFQASFTSMNTTIDLFKSKLASVLSVPLTAFFDSITESLQNPDGALRKITLSCIDLIETLVKVTAAFNFGPAVTYTFNLIGTMIANTVTQLSGLIKVLGGLAIALINIKSPFGKEFQAGMNMAIEGVKQIGSMKAPAAADAAGDKQEKAADKTALAADKTAGAADKSSSAADKHLTAAERAAQASEKLAQSGGTLDGAGGKVASGGEKLAEAGTQLLNNANYAGDKLGKAADSLSQAAQALQQAAQGKSGGKAAGGPIKGPGGPRDDTAGLFALSNGEFVMQTAAVEHYGAPLFEALNNIAVGGFATGGAVGGGVRSAPAVTPTSASAPSSILNLRIGDQQFNGLTAPEHVASKLKTYAVGRQTASAGRRPSWAS